MSLLRPLSLFLVDAFIRKRARLLQSLVFLGDEIFVQFVQLNEYLGNASKLSQRAPFQFLVGAFRRKTQTIVVTSFFLRPTN